MNDSQKKWRDEQKKAGNKLLSFWFSLEDIERMDNLVDRLELKNRADLIRKAFDAFCSQGEPNPFQDRLALLEKRIDALEAAPQKKPAAVFRDPVVSSPVIIETEKKWPPAAASYNPDEVKRILIEMDDQEASDIAKHLNDRGFTTVRGLWWSVNTVNKARHKIRNNQWVD